MLKPSRAFFWNKFIRTKRLLTKLLFSKCECQFKKNVSLAAENPEITLYVWREILGAVHYQYLSYTSITFLFKYNLNPSLPLRRAASCEQH